MMLVCRVRAITTLAVIHFPIVALLVCLGTLMVSATMTTPMAGGEPEGRDLISPVPKGK